MVNRVEVITIPYEVYKSDINILLDRIDRLEQKLLSQNSEDKLIRIGGVKEILQSKNIKCTDNRTVQRWLDENNIRTQYKEGSTSKYYSKNEVLKCLNDL